MKACCAVAPFAGKHAWGGPLSRLPQAGPMESCSPLQTFEAAWSSQAAKSVKLGFAVMKQPLQARPYRYSH